MTGEQARAGEMDALEGYWRGRWDNLMDIMDEQAATGIRYWLRAEDAEAERDQARADLAAARREYERMTEDLSQEVRWRLRTQAQLGEARQEIAALQARIEAAIEHPTYDLVGQIRAALDGQP